MKLKLLFIIGALMLLAQTGAAQRFGYVDSQHILDQMSDYQAVQKEIEQLSQQWEKEVQDAYGKIEKMYQDYKAKEVLLSRDDKQRMQEEIMDEEKKAKELQKKHFGVEGDLFKIREEKIRPIQQRVYETVEQVAKENKVNMMLDKASSTTILYADPAYEFTDKVLTKLGVSPTKKTTPDGK